MDAAKVVRHAQWDQVTAMFRDERRRLCKMMAANKKRDWHRSPCNVNTLAQYLIRGVSDANEIHHLIKWAIIDAKKHRTEFVIARCIELDGVDSK